MRYIAGMLAILCLTAVASADPPADPVRCTVQPLANEITLGVPFGLEFVLENTSNTALAVPDPRCAQAELAGWCHVQIFQQGFSESRPINPGNTGVVELSGGTEPPTTPAAKEVLLLAPKAAVRFTAWVLWEDEAAGPPEKPQRITPPSPGRCQMRIYYKAGYNLPTDPAAALQATLWIGPVESPNQAIDVVRTEPAKVVAMTLEFARKQKGSEERRLARTALAAMTCRHFGKGPAMTDADVAEAEKWFATNSAKSHQSWITAALGSADPAERREAAAVAFLVKDPGLADALVAALNPDEPDISVKVLDALWANYNEPRAMDYARKVLRSDAPYLVRARVIKMAFQHKVQPIMKEGGEALLGWIKAEQDPQVLTMMIATASICRLENLAATLEELDRRQPTPVPEKVILALSWLEGSDYRPRLLQHLLQNKDPTSRYWAAVALTGNGDNTCLDALIVALADPSDNVSIAACRAIHVLWHGATPQQYDKAMEALIRLVDEYGKNNPSYPRAELEEMLVFLNPGASPPAETDDHKLAEAWRAIWQNARKK